MIAPDPLGFTLDLLAARGALVEPGADGVLALLPARLSHELGLPEELRLSSAPDAPGAVACGFGSPLLERLVGEVRARPAAGLVRLHREAPRANRAQALAERFVLRNGLSEVVDVTPGEAWYVSTWIAYVAEADDRHEGLVRVVLQAPGGAVPDDSFAALLDPATLPSDITPVPGDLPSEAGAAARWIAMRAEVLVREALQPSAQGLARRHARDHARIVEYFADMAAEARSPRRKVDPATVAAKVAHLVAERDAKLRDLVTRYTLRVRLGPAATLCVTTPVACARVRLRRKREVREILLRLPAAAPALDRPACEGCGGPAPRPAACDDRFHLLCEVCAPSHQGRPHCPACARRDGPLA